MNPFLSLVESGALASLDDLRAFYKTEVKRLHPDLNGVTVPRVDFDRLKQDYAEAFRYMVAAADREAQVQAAPVAAKPPAGKDALQEEFRELVARGFPVNVQAAAKNRAYAGSIRRVAAFLEDRFGDADFFARANREARALKRLHPKTHWYVLQIFWNLGDWRLTGYDYYRRIFKRHLEFIRETLEDEGYTTLLQLLEYLAE
jgi:hypothetical protein